MRVPAPPFRSIWFCLALLARATICAGENNPAVPSPVVPSDDNFRTHRAFNQKCEEQVAAMQGKPCDVIFIGDSITQNFAQAPTAHWPLVGQAIWEKYYGRRHVLNFGVGADATQNVLWRFEQMNLSGFHPKVAVVLIGTNNTRNSASEIALGVAAVVRKTKHTFPGVQIILVSILPNARATAKMAAVNDIIQDYGDGRTVFYFDLAAQMTPEGNSWKGLGFDRLHLAPAGYELWAAGMEPLLSGLLGDEPVAPAPAAPDDAGSRSESGRVPPLPQGNSAF